MMERFLSAPGKLFLSGEYAILWGGTARVAAVGPRTSALVRRREDRQVHLVLAEGRLIGHATHAGINWGKEIPVPFRFAARALGEAYRAHGQEALGLDLALSPSFAMADGRKLGMGGSARACVLAAEAARFVLEAKFDSLKVALLAHGLEQGLKGSGGDVAAVFAGALVRYRRFPIESLANAFTVSPQAALAESPPVDLARVNVPMLFLTYAFTGESASTRSLISQVEQRMDPAARERFVSDSDEAGDALERALIQGDFKLAAESMRRLHELLCGLGALETEPMRRILALAASFGSAGKISGAGGGDGCVLLSPDSASQQRMLEGLSSRGLMAFPLVLEPGLRGEAAPNPVIRGWL